MYMTLGLTTARCRLLEALLVCFRAKSVLTVTAAPSIRACYHLHDFTF